MKKHRWRHGATTVKDGHSTHSWRCARCAAVAYTFKSVKRAPDRAEREANKVPEDCMLSLVGGVHAR